jgi:3-keto-L-gulonate-6-phosphate decarboxylase
MKKETKALIAVSGGLNLDNIRIAKDSGADIFIIGKKIYKAKNPQSKIDDFLIAIS